MNNEHKVTVFSATVENITTRKDKTLKITIGTQELPPAKMAALFAMQNNIGYVAIKAEDFGRAELEALEAAKAEVEDGDTTKTASRRQRSVLYRLWEQKPEGFKTFELFYASKMEEIITHFKNKLT